MTEVAKRRKVSIVITAQKQKPFLKVSAVAALKPYSAELGIL